MTEPKLQNLKIMRPMFVVAFILAVLLPEAAWANFAPTPGTSEIPMAMIILLPLVIILTDLGGGYKILEARSGKKHNPWAHWVPVLAFIIISAPIIFGRGELGILISFPIILFCVYRALWLIYMGLYNQISKNPPPWREHVKPWRLMISGGVTIGVIVIVYFAVMAAIHEDKQEWRATRSFRYVKADLHNVYLACKAYWYDNGSDKSCSRDIAQTTYGYIPHAGVVVWGKGGDENNFRISAVDSNRDKGYEVDHLGAITEISGYSEIAEMKKELAKAEKAKQKAIEDKKKEKSNVFAEGFNFLVQILK